MGNYMKIPNEIPEWLSIMRADSCLNVRDMASLFGVKKPAIFKAITEGRLPRPTNHSRDFLEGGPNEFRLAKNNSLWRSSVIKDFIKNNGLK